MRKDWHSIKILGLSLLAALGLMAVTAAGAQAGEFRLEGSTFASKGIASESITGTITKSKLTVPWFPLTIDCSLGGGLSGKIFQGGKVEVEGYFEGCTVENNKFCKIYPTKADLITETNSGKIRTTGEGEVILMGEKHFVKFESKEFNTVFIGTAKKGCTLPQEMVANGGFQVEAPTALTSSVNQAFTALTSEEAEKLFGTKLLCGVQPASVLGSTGSISLSGANKGSKWGFE